MWNLLSAEDVKDLSKGGFGSDFDLVLEKMLIPAVGQTFAAYCNRPDFDLKIHTEYFSPELHQRSLTLSCPPIAPTIISLRTGALKWLVSSAGTGIYYVVLLNGTSASLVNPASVLENDVEMVRAQTAVLSAGEFFYGDADALGFDTVYVRLGDSADPDSKALGYVKHSLSTLRLWEDYSTPRTYATESINGTDFFADESAGIIYKENCYFRYGSRTVKVTYSGGFLTGDGIGVPADLKLAAVMQTKILFDRRDEISLQSKSMEGGSISLLTPLSLPKSVTLFLDRYKVFR